MDTNGCLHIGGVVLGTDVDMKVDVVVLVRPRAIVCCGHCVLCTPVVVLLKLGMVSTKCRRFDYLLFFIATYYYGNKCWRRRMVVVGGGRRHGTQFWKEVLAEWGKIWDSGNLTWHSQSM